MAAEMLAAYYDRSCDSRNLFADLQIAQNPTFEEHLNMSCVLSIAYYYAHGDYIFHREYQTDTGFADLVLMPRKNTSTPAIIVELKYNDTTNTAIDQIYQRNYPAKVAEYTGDILLVAISYDKKTKEHQCRIERLKIEH